MNGYKRKRRADKYRHYSDQTWNLVMGSSNRMISDVEEKKRKKNRIMRIIAACFLGLAVIGGIASWGKESISDSDIYLILVFFCIAFYLFILSFARVRRFLKIYFSIVIPLALFGAWVALAVMAKNDTIKIILLVSGILFLLAIYIGYIKRIQKAKNEGRTDNSNDTDDEKTKKHNDDYLEDEEGLLHDNDTNVMDTVDFMEGHQFEEYCAEILREKGFVDVSVTPGSGDQGVDILAAKDGIKYAIQCKNYSSPLSNKPIQEVNAGKMFYNCHVGVVMTNSTFTPGAVALAKATGTLLWDRSELEKMLKDIKY